MKGLNVRRLFLFLFVSLLVARSALVFGANPVVPGWYADPHVAAFGDRYWIYATVSDRDEGGRGVELTAEQQGLLASSINPHYLTQTHLTAFSSRDLVGWEPHPGVLSVNEVSWAAYAMWAPAAIEVDDRYYLYFSANDIQSDSEPGGIGVAVADSPEGPFRDAIGAPLIDRFVNDAQPIDPFVFTDDDGARYLYYGGWGHCNVARLGAKPTELGTLEDGSVFREVTPEGYVEGPCMMKRRGLYYFMWSEGGWGGPDYSVAYAIADSPLGPFRRVAKILQQDEGVATGAGHHSVLSLDNDRHYIVYHRRPLGDEDPNHRVVCIESLSFAQDGRILPVKLTRDGVQRPGVPAQ